MHSNPYLVLGILALVLVIPLSSVYGQTVTFANHVVINEVELNPSGDYSTQPLQWVELYNPTDSPVNIGGWTIGATTGLKQVYTIPSGTTIASQQFIVYHYVPLWFPNAGAVIQLKNSGGSIIDQTPPLTDTQSDGLTQQRLYDAYNTGAASDWALKSGTPGFSNGKPAVTTTVAPLTISVSSDKQSYVFGDIVNIGGQVSKIVKNPAVESIPQTVNLLLSGPNGFSKTFSLYPGTDLKFSTYVKPDQVLGFSEGTYTISATYAGVKSSSTFALGSAAFVAPTQAAPVTMNIYADSTNYTITQPIVLQGSVSKVIPLTSVSYKVYDPTNTVVYQGTLFPGTDGKFTTVNQYQRSAANSGILINSVNPVYGLYRVDAKYDQASAVVNFVLLRTGVQSQSILVSTDKKSYLPGDTVVISGSTNFAGLQNIGIRPNIQILQTTATGSSGTVTQGNRGIVPNAFSSVVSVLISSDNSFTYKFQLPSTSDSLGSYRVVASIPTGIAKSDFVVSDNPQSNTVVSTPSSPFAIVTDKPSYTLGEHVSITGHILNPIQLSTQNAVATVKITILTANGSAVSSGGTFKNNLGVPTSIPLVYSAVPDANGNFQIQQTLQTGIYNVGTYTLKATYSNLVTSTTFSVYDPLQINVQSPIVASTDKKVYSPGDMVKLDGKISSLVGAESYTVTLIKPTGNQISFPLPVVNGMFSWSWKIPLTDTSKLTILTTDRSASPVFDPARSVYGIYQIKISSDHTRSQIFFQVSQNPNQDLSQITLQTDKTDYLSTDTIKILGQVIPTSNPASAETNQVISISIFSDSGQQVYRGDATVNQGGQYYATIPMHTGVWKTGKYNIYAQFSSYRFQSSINVKDQFATSNTKLQLFITTDTDKYLAGQTVLITGRTSYIVSVPEGADLTFGLTNDTVVSEGQVTSKSGRVLQHANVKFDQYGSFTYDYVIPANASPGNYNVVAQVPFGTTSVPFNVVSQLPTAVIQITNQTQTTNQTQANTNQTQPNTTPVTTLPTVSPLSIGPMAKHSTANTFVQKSGKISDPTVAIAMGQSSLGSASYYPKEFDGLLRVNPGKENSASIKVVSPGGTCVIGQDASCLVSASTVQSGALYQKVSIDGMNYLVGYTGTGIRLQQFSIIPANSGDVIPDGIWVADILQKDQSARFYYQVSYSK